ncbi:type VI secretion system protein TssA, partial [Burkholderia diffusa]
GPSAGSRDGLVAALSTARDDGRVPIDAVRAVLGALDAIRARVTDRLGSEWSPDASDTEKALQRIVREMPEPAPVQAAGPADGSIPAMPAAPGAAHAASAPATVPNGQAWRDAEVASRDDVRLGLDKICRYFELHEPSHPAPLLLRRAQRLLALDFYEIIRDLAPESLPKLDLLSGERSE